MINSSYLKKFDLPILASLLILPILSLICMPIYIYKYGIVLIEPLLLVVGWFIAGMGITVGYHRLFAHRSFKTNSIVEWILMISGSMALQNTIINWCSDHRIHHKKLDTKHDPYSIKKGFLHAHIGWIVKKNDRNIQGVSDLEKKTAIIFQNKYYWPLSLFLSFIVPMLIGFYFNRPFGGLLWGGILRVTLVHHFTFFINSLCHFVGKQNYQLNTSARDSWLIAFVTFGEGYHNFHHKFQWDYRNGINWYDFDPSKWIIKFLSYFKLTHTLRKASDYSIYKARITTIYERIQLVSKENIYSKRIIRIMKTVSINLDLLNQLEKKYQSINFGWFNDDKKRLYNEKKRLYSLELQKSLSSLMMILINLKSIN